MANRMRVAVTGSTGLIGRAMVERLEAGGHQVVRVVRPGSSDMLAPSMSVAWNPTTSRIEAAGLEGLDAVVHLAGEPIAARRWSPEQKERIARSRAQGTALLAETLARLDAPPAVLVSASAIGYYGDRGDELLDESSSGG
ncbi:MAG: NAD-dependent epimerase/dehydratase family protein, partial [Acidimicrobiaceae bacterium]|nr:NAD-dependent epimerase/dehydratase family protein [Acidimicrobiaceae bacterium]